MKKFLFIILYLSLKQLQLNAQTFYRDNSTSVIENGTPFKNPWAGGFNSPNVSQIDLNMDGIKDLFTFDITNNRIETFINYGTANTSDYHFDPQYISKFPIMHDWVLLHDYNCDGMEDIFTVSDLPGSIRVFKNTSTMATGLQFTLITDQVRTLISGVLWTNLPVTNQLVPIFDDVDRDGDLDVIDFPTSPDATLDFHKNFSMENGYACDSLIFEQSPSCWGNFVMCLGTNKVCKFGAGCKPAPFEPLAVEVNTAKRDDTLTSICAIDIDGDNDTDILVGDVGSPHSLMVQNGGDSIAANMVAQDTLFPEYNTPVTCNSFLQHRNLDLNNDGLKDLIASPRRENFNTGMFYYRDTSATVAPEFSFTDSMFLQREMIELGRFVFPAVLDYDSDGLNDLIVGNLNYAPLVNGIKSGLALFKNTGTPTHPAFSLIDRNYADVNNIASTFPVGGVAPCFGDLDSDGDPDMLIGSEDGKLYYFKNTSPGGLPNFVFSPGVIPGLDNVDAGNFSSPQIVDLDRDGLQDVIAGSRKGTINFYKNIGTQTIPAFNSFPTIDTLGGLLLVQPPGVTGYTSPFFYDNNGTYKLYVACEKGDVYLYDSIDNNLNGTFNLVQTLISNTEGKNLNIGVGDLNSDNKEDLIVGNMAGGFGIYFNDVNPNAVAENIFQIIDWTFIPNPANDVINIHLTYPLSTYPLSPYTLALYTIDGKMILSKRCFGVNETINIKNLTQGVYFLRLNAGDSSSTKKLFVIHE